LQNPDQQAIVVNQQSCLAREVLMHDRHKIGAVVPSRLRNFDIED
jgi:hypothetical protein